ncbi:MAG: phage tail tape measure protein [Desulfurococcaceae archaeon]
MDAFTLAITLQLIDNFSRELSQLKEGVERVASSVNNAQRAIQTFGEKVKKAFDPKNLWEFSEKLESIALKSAQAAGAPLALLGKAMSSFEELENAKIEMEVAFMTKTGLPKELETIKKQVEELGVKLPGSTKDFYAVATALKNIGLSAKDISGGLLEATSYAWVLFKNEVSPQKAAEYMGEFANAFKVPADQFKEFIDQLQRLKFASGLSLTEIAYSTKYFSAELNQLGLTGLKTSELMFNWLGTLKQMGLKGETAGTSIRSVLQNIINFEENAKKLAKKGITLDLDVKSFVKDGQFQLEEFLMAIRDKISQIQDPLKRMEALKTLFDTEGMRAIAPLLAKNKEEALAFLETIKDTLSPEEYENFKKNIEKGAFSGLEGMAKAMSEQASLQQRIDRMLQSFANVKEAFFGTLAGFGATVGELFAPPLIKIFNLLNDLFDKLGDFIQRHQTLAKVIGYPIGAFLGFIAILGTVSLALASFLKLLSFAFFPFQLLKKEIVQIIPWLRAKALVLWQNIRALAIWLISLTKAAFSAVFSRLISALRGVTLAIRAFNLSLLFSPVGLFIAGIAAIIGIGYLLYRNWDKVVKAISTAWEWLKNNWKKLAQFLLMLNPFTALLLAINAIIKKLLE